MLGLVAHLRDLHLHGAPLFVAVARLTVVVFVQGLDTGVAAVPVLAWYRQGFACLLELFAQKTEDYVRLIRREEGELGQRFPIVLLQPQPHNFLARRLHLARSDLIFSQVDRITQLKVTVGA